MMDVVTIRIDSENPDAEWPATCLSEMVETGKMGQFVFGVTEGHAPWQVICWLEEDMLRRFPDFAKEGSIVVGHCALAGDVPAYNEWGDLQAWLECDQGGYLFPVTVNEDRQGEDQADLVVHDCDDFYANAEIVQRVPFCDESGILFNRALKSIRELEEMLH